MTAVLEARDAVVRRGPREVLHGVSLALEGLSLNDPAVKPKLLELGFEIVGNTPEQFTAFQAAEFARWKKVIEVGKITAD